MWKLYLCHGALWEADCNHSVENSRQLFKGSNMRNKDGITIFNIHSKFDITA
jgi:hypothetical protein